MNAALAAAGANVRKLLRLLRRALARLLRHLAHRHLLSITALKPLRPAA